MNRKTASTFCILTIFPYAAFATASSPTENTTSTDSILIPQSQEDDFTPITSPASNPNAPTTSISPEAEEQNATVKRMLEESQTYVKQKKFTQALATLAKAQKIAPDNYDVQLTTAKILSWKKDYKKAQNILATLLTHYPNNTDILLVQGYLYYYQDQLTAAQATFTKILTLQPHYADAQKALTQVKLAMLAQQKKQSIRIASRPAPTLTPVSPSQVWRIDVGTEYSALYRTTLSNWNQEFTQVTRFFNDNNSTVHGRVDRYYQFNEVDTQYEVGGSQRFKPWFNAYLYGLYTPDANFRPIWGIGSGGEMRFNQVNKPGFNGWATVDIRDYDYIEIGSAINLNPGLRVEYNDKWDLIARNINLFANGQSQSGWLFQTHAELVSGLRANVGISQAPDIENLVTYTVKSIFTGFSIDITPSITFNFEYIRDDYVNAYLRQAFNGTFTFKL